MSSIRVPGVPPPRWGADKTHPCLSCGRDNVELYDVGAFNNWYAACLQCYLKHGASALMKDGNAIMSKVVGKIDPRVVGTCRKCGKKMDRDSWMQRIWCDSCEAQRLRIERGQAP